MIAPKRFSEALGLWAGSVMAPIFAVGSLLRQDRIFHSRGLSFLGEVTPAEDVKEMFAEVAQGLSQGPALVRMAPGMWRGEKGLMPDVLGISIRFLADPANDFEPQDRSQDLLLVTSKRIIGLPMAALATNQRDFLDNVYYGGAKFEVAGHPNLRIRAVPLTKGESDSPNRFEKLRESVAAGDVAFRLEIYSMLEPSMNSPLVEIRLTEEVTVNEEELQMDPFRIGQDIRPQGFVQFLRPVPYLLSQWARDI